MHPVFKSSCCLIRQTSEGSENIQFRERSTKVIQKEHYSEIKKRNGIPLKVNPSVPVKKMSLPMCKVYYGGIIRTFYGFNLCLKCIFW